MTFWIEWVLAVHRAVWFPLNWTTGLERPGTAVPLEFAPALAGQVPLPSLRVIKGGRSEGTPARPRGGSAGKRRARILR